MCLATYKRAEILEKDLIVWKLVSSASKNVCYSEIHGFRYKTQKLYSLDNDLLFHEFVDKDLLYDSQCVNEYLNSKWKPLKDSLRLVKEGFHFALDRKRFEKAEFNDIYAEFLVPKGAEVAYDDTGLGVSSKIMYTGKFIIQ